MRTQFTHAEITIRRQIMEDEMSNMFSSLEDAVVWLYTQGWRQNEAGEWLKGKRKADIRKSPAGDGVVCVVFVRP